MLFLVSFVDLLISIKLWKSVLDDSEGTLPTVYAMYATAAEENLQNLLVASEDSNRLREVLRVWLKLLGKKKLQVRRERKTLVEITVAKKHSRLQLGDSLYANSPYFNLCKDLKIDYLIVRKEKVLKQVRRTLQ